MMRIRIVAAAVAACAAVLLVAGAMASGKAGHQASTSASSANKALFAVLAGSKEVGDKGDKDGRGSFTAIVDGGKLCFGITATNLDKPVAAHIHKGKASANGDVVVPLVQPSAGDPGASSGCVTVKAALAKAILKNPAGYYANVHTTKFPGGAIRGQLFSK